MDMLSVEQVAEKWNVTTRTIQNLCKTGRIPGAVAFGKSWMIPADAERPRDGRYKGTDAAKQNTAPKIVIPVQSPMMIMSPFYNKPGTAEKCIKSLSAMPETRALFAGQVAFWQGDVPKALELILPLLDVDADFYGSLNIGMTLMAVSMWQNDNTMWDKGREYILSAPCADNEEQEIRDIWLAITDNTVTEPQIFDAASYDKFNHLPSESIPLYLFYYAKYLHRVGINVARGEAYITDIQNLGVIQMFPYLAEPLIAYIREVGAIIPEIYLHLLCADAYNKIGLKDKSEHHLDIAISLCLPDKLYGVLAEYRGLMSNALDECLDRISPEITKEVKQLEKKMYANWMEMLNKNSDLVLSCRQKEVARLAAIGLSNKEIAERLHISSHTVKSTISMIMNKTGASKRSEFASYIH